MKNSYLSTRSGALERADLKEKTENPFGIRTLVLGLEFLRPLKLRSSAAALTFLMLSAIATLFPPFHWSPKRMQTENERRAFEIYHKYLYDQIPIKTYSFLFGASSRPFLEWSWDGRQSVQKPAVLRRQLVASELVLEYVLSGFIACVVGIILGRCDRARTPANS